MKTFFGALKNSIWNPSFYAVLASKTTRESVSYFLNLLLLTSFVAVAAITIFIVPPGLAFLRKAADVAVGKYPTDLEVVFSGGFASTTVAGIRRMELPNEIFDAEEKLKLNREGIENLIVVDTSRGFDDRQQFSNAKSMVLLTKDSFVVKKNGSYQGGFEVNPIPKDFDLIVTKSLVENWATKIIKISKFILPLLIVIGFAVLFIMSAVIYLILAIVSAAIIWMIARIAKRKGKYGEFFNVALYAVTLPVLLDTALFIFGYPQGLSFITALAITVLVWMLNVKIWGKTNLPSVDVNEPPMKV